MFSRGSSTKSLGLAPGAAAAAAAAQAAAARHHPLSLCADCGAQGPTWASVNRGVLLCADCTSVHRSLGRHVSHVRSIRVGHWVPEQLTMVQSLYSCGANSIWEYSLLNPSVTHSSSSKGSSSSVRREQLKKPSASDPLHPVKGNFISAKYQQLAFVYRPAKDEPAVSESELSRQLHSSVRTPNLETSLRLISQGADPNYFHPEKNSTPLQVAAKAGQACQVELLLVHGADPGAVDKNGRTASDYARASGHPGLAARIFSSQFELSDRLSFFLCQRRPDHSSPEASHFLVPDMSDLLSGLAAPGGKSPEERRVAKRKLQGLSNSVFEELAMDVYDEVDRRETDEVWAKAASSSSSSSSSKAAIIPFLPVNPEYGTTRNQGRQKLARLSREEFMVLVLDVLKEVRRRQSDMNSRWTTSSGGAGVAATSSGSSPLRESPGQMRGAAKNGQTKSLPAGADLSDDEPIYDHVASDDDYYHIPENVGGGAEAAAQSSVGALGIQRRPHSSSGPSSSVNSSPSKSNASYSSGGRAQKQLKQQQLPSSIRPSEYTELRAQLENSEVKVQRLIESNDDMRSEIARLSVTVSRLVSENEHLKKSMSPTHSSYSNSGMGGVGASATMAGGGSASNLIRSGGGGGDVPYADAPPIPSTVTGGGSNRGSPATRMFDPRNPQQHSLNHNNHSSSQSGPASMPHTGATYMTLPSKLASGGGGGRAGGGPGFTNSGSFQAHPQQPQQPQHPVYDDPFDYDSRLAQQGTSSPRHLQNLQHLQQSSTSSLPFALQSSSAGPPPPPAPSGPPPPSQQQHEYMEPRELVGSRPSTTTTTTSSSSNDNMSGPIMPSQEEVVRRTEAITRCIQELLISAKDERFDAFIPCSERIVRAVTDMVVLFPEEPLDAGVSSSLSSLTAAATHFETECRVLIVRSQSEPLNQGFVTQQVIQCAFDIAKATKQLVALFQ